jgi:integrase
MASYRQRGQNQLWEYRVKYTDATGKQRVYSLGGFHTQAAAIVAANKIEELVARGGNPFDSNILFLDFWDSWVETYRLEDVADITAYRYDLFRKHLEKQFDGRQLKSIKPMEWQQFLNTFAAGKDRKTPHRRSKDMVSKLNGYVRAMVKSAINQQIIYTDFTFDAKPHGVEESGKIKFLEAEDFAYIKTRSKEEASYQNVGMLAVYIACMTGMRVSEILALTWKNVDEKKHLIRVTRSWNEKKREFKPTKTESSVRRIEVSDEVLATLSKFHADQRAAYLKTGYRDDEQMIFRSRYHTVITDSSCNKALKALEDEARIDEEEQVTLHGLRHSHVSYLLAHDVDIYYISKRLGHKDISITMKVYGHLLDKRRRQEADKAVRLLDAL